MDPKLSFTKSMTFLNLAPLTYMLLIFISSYSSLKSKSVFTLVTIEDKNL